MSPNGSNTPPFGRGGGVCRWGGGDLEGRDAGADLRLDDSLHLTLLQGGGQRQPAVVRQPPGGGASGDEGITRHPRGFVERGFTC